MRKPVKFHTVLALALASFVILALLQQLLMPKYMGTVVEGALTSEYYIEESNPVTASHDLLILGDCEVFDNVSTEALWDQYGIHSFIRGNAQQTMWQSYYMLEESLRYEKPKVVLLSVFGMQFDGPQSEVYNRMALDSMKWSKTKLACIKASMTEEESLASYFFPILRYHERWNQLEQEDIKYFFQREAVTCGGYIKHEGIKEADAEALPPQVPLGSYEFGQMPMEYLERITALCKENDITLVLYKAPSLYPVWYEEWDQQIKTYARENELLYINSYEALEEIGIDYQVDSYDAGLHLNDAGARKMGSYIGKILSDQYHINGQKENDELCSIWDLREKNDRN